MYRGYTALAHASLLCKTSISSWWSSLSIFPSGCAFSAQDWGGKEERLGDVVAQLKAQYGLQFVYCWHGLPAYWAGVMPDMEGHPGTLLYASPTPGVLEVRHLCLPVTALDAAVPHLHVQEIGRLKCAARKKLP